MARKNGSPKKAAMRKMVHDYLKNNDISIKNGLSKYERRIFRNAYGK